MSVPKPSLEKNVAQTDNTPVIKCYCCRPWIGSQYSMLSFLLLGVGLAVLHHFYYKYLDGQAIQEHPHQQQLANGIGTGFAFATKMFLALAVSTAYTQRIWKTAREKPFSLCGLDAMFSATTNATAFFTYEMILHWSSFLALIVW